MMKPIKGRKLMRAMCAREINLPEVLFMGKGEELTGGRFRDSIVSDAMEAVIGSIYLDGGIECAREFINKFILADIKDKQLFVDSKTILQERIQAGYKEGPEYIITGESGPDHCKVFEAEVRIEGRLIGSGKGRTKKAAEQQAAYNAIMDMELSSRFKCCRVILKSFAYRAGIKTY